ncbi:MAG: hypothetical protein JNK79_14805 [Chitinophagaceae bacterium]|nr:hypothetical protein [Chitinophagaceae bacterium]
MKLRSLLAVSLFMVMAVSCRKNISPETDSGSIYGQVVSSDATVAERVWTLKHVGKYSDENLAAARTGGGIVFGGNSQMERLLYNNWDATWKGLPVINRAIGGTTWAEQIPYIDDLFTDYRPKVIVLYQGENEYLRAPVTTNKQISKTIEPNFIKFYDKLRARNPKAKIIIVSMVACPELFKRGYDVYKSGFTYIYDIDNLNKIYKNKLAKDNAATRVTTRFVDIKPYYQFYAPTRWYDASKFQPDGIHIKYPEYTYFVNKVKPVVTDLYQRR